MSEAFGNQFEKPLAPDTGFQPEVIPEWVSDEELADFFILHLSEPRPEGISPEYHARELAYYKQEAERALGRLDDERARSRLETFLRSHTK